MRSAEFKFELDRKMFHLSSLVIPFSYIFIPKLAMCLILAIVTAIILYIDISRHYDPRFQGLVDKFFRRIMRSIELNGSFSLSGMSFFFLGILLVVALFSKGLAIASMLVLIFADSAAALIGQKCGIPLSNGKSLVGLGAFLGVSIVVSIFSYFVVGYATSFKIIIMASTITALAEFYSGKLRINDNFLVPVVYAFATFILSLIF